MAGVVASGIGIVGFCDSRFDDGDFELHGFERNAIGFARESQCFDAFFFGIGRDDQRHHARCIRNELDRSRVLRLELDERIRLRHRDVDARSRHGSLCANCLRDLHDDDARLALLEAHLAIGIDARQRIRRITLGLVLFASVGFVARIV